MPQTLVQKLLARAAGRETVAVGERIEVPIHRALLDEGPDVRAIEASNLGAMLAAFGTRVADPSRLVLTLAEPAGGRRRSALAAWAERIGARQCYASLGVGALVMAQAGHVRPGAVVVAPLPLAGAFGALPLLPDATSLKAVLTGTPWATTVPATEFVRWTGRLPPGLCAVDLLLAMRQRGRAAAPVVECHGEAIDALPVDGRIALAAGAASLGARAVLMAADAATAAWLRDKGVAAEAASPLRWARDEGAPGTRHVLDASALTPLVALPGSEPGADLPVRTIDDNGPAPLRLAVLAGASGGQLDGLRAAARVITGYRIAEGMTLLVAPATRLDREIALREGVLRRLAEAGATILPGWTVDAAHAAGIDADRIVATEAAPFSGAAAAGADAGAVGTIGAPGPRVWQASACTVAASALRGRLADARDLLA